MKKSALFLVTVCLLFVACERNSLDNNKVSGVLTPGNDLAPSEISEITLYLGKYSDTLAFEEITSDTDEIELIDSTVLDEEGYFEFSGLEKGSYSLITEPDFIFSHDTIQIFRIDGSKEVEINNTIERVPPDNLVIMLSEGSSKWLFCVKNKLSSSIRIDSIRMFADGELIYSFAANDPGDKAFFNLGFPEDSKKRLQFVFFNKETNEWFDSPLCSPVSWSYPVKAGPVKIDYRFKWLYFEDTFYFKD